MKGYRAVVLFFIIVFALAGCGPKGEMKEYTFEAVDDLERIFGTSRILRIAKGYSAEEDALIQGQLLTLFGEPAQTSMDLENAYTYVILARDDEGNEYYLSAYAGPSGPAIGGDSSVPGTEDAAEALKDCVREAAPADYEYNGFYFDTSSKIIQGVSEGRVYYEETLMTEEQFMEALTLCGR